MSIKNYFVLYYLDLLYDGRVIVLYADRFSLSYYGLGFTAWGVMKDFMDEHIAVNTKFLFTIFTTIARTCQ